MSENTAGLRHKIRSASDLQSVVRTMKLLAATNVGQYEKSVQALTDYLSAIELGLGECIRQNRKTAQTLDLGRKPQAGSQIIDVVVFGSDQGLVGQFNDILADHVIQTLANLQGALQLWVVGEQVSVRLTDAKLPISRLFPVPDSIDGITPLIGELQIESEIHQQNGDFGRVYVFHNRLLSKTQYEPIGKQLLPLDSVWQENMVRLPWPTRIPPEILGGIPATLHAFIREYLFISFFQSCAESLACENICRLNAMDRADRNICELLEQVHSTLNRVRQSAIDEELFDVISAYTSFQSESANIDKFSR